MGKVIWSSSAQENKLQVVSNHSKIGTNYRNKNNHFRQKMQVSFCDTILFRMHYLRSDGFKLSLLQKDFAKYVGLYTGQFQPTDGLTDHRGLPVKPKQSEKRLCELKRFLFSRYEVCFLIHLFLLFRKFL